jgi:hypothetical protein
LDKITVRVGPFLLHLPWNVAQPKPSLFPCHSSSYRTGPLAASVTYVLSKALSAGFFNNIVRSNSNSSLMEGSTLNTDTIRDSGV